MRCKQIASFALAVAASSSIPASAADWSRFRGPGGAGVADAADLPEAIGADENLAWRVPSGAGASSPIVAGDRVFITLVDGDQRTLRCLDLVDGATRWEQSLAQVRTEATTAPCDPATPTPVADGERVFALFPDAGMICCSLDGERQWDRELPPFHSFHGVASSLVAADGLVFLLADQLTDSYLQAFDAATGEPRWRADRGSGAVGGFSTPTIRLLESGPELIVSGPQQVIAYEPSTGAERWSLPGATNAPISTPIVDGDRLFVCEPFYEENPFKIEDLAPYDKNKDGLVGLDELPPGDRMQALLASIDSQWGNGDEQLSGDELAAAFGTYVKSGGLVAIDVSRPEPRIDWRYQKTVPQIASPVLYGDLLYFLNDGGILVAVDPGNGVVVRRGRLGQSGRQYYASPVAGDGKLYVVDTDGKAAIVRAGRDWELIGLHDLGAPCYATPAIAGERLLIRTEESLFCFRDDGERAGDDA